MATKKQQFIEYVSNCMNFDDAPDGVKDYWTAFTASTPESEKPPITEKGVEVLKNIRAYGQSIFKTRDIAEYMGMASRSVSGTLTKLKNDGFLEKLSDSPAIYSLTEKGKTFEI